MKDEACWARHGEKDEEVEATGKRGDDERDEEEEDTLRCKPCLRLTMPRAVSGVPALARAADLLARRLLPTPPLPA